jgi:hypothetical protein
MVNFPEGAAIQSAGRIKKDARTGIRYHEWFFIVVFLFVGWIMERKIN